MPTSADRRPTLIRLFGNRGYRRRYVENFYNTRLATQIKLLREARSASQEKLAKQLETQQSAISKLESANYTSWNVKTLRRLARAFDVALQVRFVTYGEALEDIEGFTKAALVKPEFKDDPVFQGAAPPQMKTAATANAGATVGTLFRIATGTQLLYYDSQKGTAPDDTALTAANDNLALAS